MFIQTEDTPNPQVIKFIPGKIVMLNETCEIKNSANAEGIPLAQSLMKIDGVTGLFFGSDFISVTKNESFAWNLIKPHILTVIMEYYAFHDSVIMNLVQTNEPDQITENENPIVQKIREIIDDRVRPAVAQDGGDIIFDHFKDGIVYVKLQGACSGCPSSSQTLKAGIENMLRHYIPEVQMVEAI